MHRAILAASGVLILIVGGQAVAAGRLSLGELLSFSVTTALLVTHLSAALAALPLVIVGREALRSVLRHRQPSTTAILRRGACAADVPGQASGGRGLVPVRRAAVAGGVDLTLPPGSLTALIGPNGAESTLLQVMLGLYEPRRSVCTLMICPTGSWTS